MSTPNIGPFPETLEYPRPETGAHGTTDKGGIGEAQATQALMAHLEDTHGNAELLTDDKHVNTPGPDFAIAYTDTEMGRESLVVGDNKDMSNPRASSWDTSPEAIDDYIGQGLNQIAATDRDEPLLANNMRAPWGIVPSYTLNEEAIPLRGEIIGDDEAPLDSQPWTIDEFTQLELAAEAQAQHGANTLAYVATTTDTPLKAPSIDALSTQGIAYTHIATPAPPQDNTLDLSAVGAPPLATPAPSQDNTLDLSAVGAPPLATPAPPQDNTLDLSAVGAPPLAMGLSTTTSSDAGDFTGERSTSPDTSFTPAPATSLEGTQVSGAGFDSTGVF